WRPLRSCCRNAAGPTSDTYQVNDSSAARIKMILQMAADLEAHPNRDMDSPRPAIQKSYGRIVSGKSAGETRLTNFCLPYLISRITAGFVGLRLASKVISPATVFSPFVFASAARMAGPSILPAR